MEGVKTISDEKTYFNKILQESFKGSKILDVEGTTTGNAGDNYMSTVFRYTVSLLDSNNNADKKELLVKKLPSNIAWREALGCELAFRNEAIAYDVIIPSMKKFRSEDNLAFPMCFHASVEYTILEDLKPLGFKMVDRRLGLDLIHAKLALKELGRFHGTSLAMKHSQPEVFADLSSKVHEIIFLPEKKDSFGPHIIESINKAVLALKVFRASGTDLFANSINKLQRLKQSAFESLMELVQRKGPLSVICHGDFYLNNIMYKYNESGDVSDIMIIDFQAFRVASLSLDLLYFLTSSLRPGVMSSHFEELMETYHSSLNEQLKKFAPTAPEVSLKEIHEELKSHSAYGLLMGFLVLPAVTALPGNAMDIEKMEACSAEEQFEKNIDMLSPEYFRRIKQIIRDFETQGYF
ncbi:uncharacterized protein [Halyomorpha halys]|uniref:uncharacterized protein n=1 Tax=Halyomorpha halys TaxID=286706 RepID=UPI0006D51041|nr:uncharacterized protein LOC106690739 [Halyomorpha halys]